MLFRNDYQNTVTKKEIKIAFIHKLRKYLFVQIFAVRILVNGFELTAQQRQMKTMGDGGMICFSLSA